MLHCVWLFPVVHYLIDVFVTSNLTVAHLLCIVLKDNLEMI